MSSARNTIFILLFFSLSVLAARASEVRVDWPDAENATEVVSRSEALDIGFNKAVYGAALELLPGSLNENRSQYLYSYLAPRAGEYVLSYSEVGVVRDPSRTLVLDVSVNRQALKETLKRLGVYYTINAFQPFDLRLSGGAQAYWEDIGRMTTLSGLTIEDGSEPRLHLELGEDGLLIGTLTAGDKEWMASSKDVEKLWIELWGSWFTRPEVDAGVFQESILVVSGWYSPEGVRAFNKLLGSWEQELESAVLTEAEMLPDGIKARWRVRYMDRRGLEERLSAYLADRGLAFEFQEDLLEKTEPEIKNPESM